LGRAQGHALHRFQNRPPLILILVHKRTTIDISEAQITRAARDICRYHIESGIELTLAERVLPDGWGRNRVWRYRVQNAPSGFPETLIVKSSKIGGGHIFNEWASLQFLNRFESLNELVPAFYGGDEALELLVLEDLGAVRDQSDLGTILEREDPVIARDALLAHARNMALLHITTAGHEEDFDNLRARFPAYERPVAKDQIEANFNWFRQMLPQFGLATSPALEQEAQAIIAHVEDPNASRAFTHGDVCPSNFAYLNQQMRFYDFEMGAFRHPFLSAAYFRISHLSCFNGSLIPLELQAEAEEVYFQAVAPLMPNPDKHQLDYSAAATTMLIWMLSLYLEKNDKLRHLATLRQRTFAVLTLYLQHSFFSAAFPHTAEVLTGLHQQLSVQWTDEEKTILPFPAFRSQ
jgi:hypothetical protein